ncbi:MAG TPA: L-serine ammonia-lyase, iron-sulfur-dependent, subunit alpha [Syntrophomonadaceae bacterium]|nr:L-serine ammonia-lyase, iron-sulfur-dependent, subunit alpha [Syntrophomonadaceae bacterium]HOQ09172.1 L-serine ammonia-lyase, iron-sulfur-dependent, subunit alpha [Syntrophomonadaceae bacterium]HPU48581.1 L-serine ammonia-lyase, iron-sulfur-dependent, subunit alpha [Syntrophomonadaceae bacterium]
MYQFHRGQDLLNICAQQNMSIAQVMLRAEAEERGWEEKQVMHQLDRAFRVMEESVKKGLNAEIKSMSGLIGGNGFKLYQRTATGGMCGNLVLKAVSYSLAVTEVNAAMGRIVAAPTAGASGVIPGIILAVTEERKKSRQQAVEALLVAGAVGKIIAANATLSGAEGGCQAEVGSASAMASAAAVYLEDGTPAMSLNAAAMALKGLLGLVCDPVAGLVEVPCSKRNATGTVNALICAEMALAGIESVIPFDEIVDAMFRVGRMMSPDLRETARGGCALTPTAQTISRNILSAL